MRGTTGKKSPGGEVRSAAGSRGTIPRRAGSARCARRGAWEPDRGTSWTSVIFGWLATLGASLILSGIVSAVVGAILSLGLRRRHGGGDYEPGGAPDNPAPGLPHRRLRGGTPSEPLRNQARPPGGTPGSGSDPGLGALGKYRGLELHRQPEQRYATQPPERRSRLGHDPDGLGAPSPALPVHRWGHRWRLGRQDGSPSAVGKLSNR